MADEVSFEAARERALDAVKAQERSMPPGEPWARVLLLEAGPERTVAEIPAEAVGGEEEAAFVYSVVRRLLEVHEDGFFASVVGADLVSEGVRREAVVVLVGDRSRLECWRALVYRRRPGGRAHLGPFEQGEVPEGLISEPLAAAQRAVI